MTSRDLQPLAHEEPVANSEVQAKTLLIVDDEQPILDLLQNVLEDAGHVVFTALDGHTALSIVQQHTVNLVLTDLMLPEMDGQALCTQLRADPRTAELPILLMTAAQHPQIYASFTSVISKPFDIDEILRQVNQYAI